eukprot:jgi/Hompol1/5441/HPOL_001935-RA
MSSAYPSHLFMTPGPGGGGAGGGGGGAPSSLPPRFPGQIHFSQKLQQQPVTQALSHSQHTHHSQHLQQQLSHSQHMLSQYNGQVSMSTTTASMQAVSTIAIGAGVSIHLQKQLEQAQQSRLSSSPHHHFRLYSSTSRSNLANGTSANNSTNGLADSQLSVASHTLHRPHSQPQQSQAQSEKTQSWTALDLGGMFLNNLSKELFRYTFVTSLYLNHNNLTSIPPEISNLNHLAILDLSGNKLTAIPAELGLIVSLRELHLFDNEITFLPPELGQLFQLDLIGLEGNPVGEPIPSLLQKDGTKGVITYLRDMCPVGTPPADREWITIEEDAYGSGSSDSFTVMCYNTLCEKYATSQSFAYTPSWALAWEYRKDLILQDILNYNADIEIEMGQYEDYFKEQLSQLAEYDGVFYPKSRSRTMGETERRAVDGCATMFKSSKFKLLEKHNIEFQQIATQRPDLRQSEDVLNRVMIKDNITVVTYLEHRATGNRLMVANAHLYWDPAYRDVKLIQTAMIMEEMERLHSVWQKVHQPDHSQPVPTTSTLVCGDFNSLQDSGVYEFLSRGHVGADHPDFAGYNYEPYSTGGLSHKLSLRSAYSHIDVMDFTNFTPSFKGEIDYVWYTNNSLAVTGLLSYVDRDYVAKSVGFPNAHHPSDHIPLVVSFRVKPAPPPLPSGRAVSFPKMN